MSTSAFLYSAVDDEITCYALDVEAATLERGKTIRVPAFVQYAWPHPSRRYLYVTTSNRGPGLKADQNHVSAYRVGADGSLTPHGEPVALRQRATHMRLDPAGTHALQAHNVPVPGVTVHAIAADGTIGAEVAQPAGLDYGIYPHQVQVTPSGRGVILVDRGNSAAHGKPEEPGALRSFSFRDGMLSEPEVVAPNGGYGFGPRHIDFHTEKEWVYVSDERTSRLYMFRMPGGRPQAQPAFTCDTLADRANEKPRQLAGTIHVHPSGRFVYVANRADYTVEHDGQKVFGGGENTITVFALDGTTGEPKPIQYADTHSFHVRTFAFDPSGRVMVCASIKPMAVREADGVKTVPALLTVFRVGSDGKLEFVRGYEVARSAAKTQYWMGIVAPA